MVILNKLVVVVAPPGGIFISSSFEGGGGGEEGSLFNLKATMISVLHKELEYKVEKLLISLF